MSSPAFHPRTRTVDDWNPEPLRRPGIHDLAGTRSSNRTRRSACLPLGFCFFLACITALLLPAANADSLFQFPAGPAAWTVDIVPSPNAKQAPATSGTTYDIKKIDVTKIGDVSRNVITWATGKTTERWCYDQLHVMVATDTYDGSPAFLSGEDITMGGDFTVGFNSSSFTWLKNELLKDTVSFRGRKCLHYQGTVTVERTVLAGAGDFRKVMVPFHCEAWIDQETLLPVALYDGSKLGVFTFHDPPTEPLNPPPAIEKAVTHYKKASAPLH